MSEIWVLIETLHKKVHFAKNAIWKIQFSNCKKNQLRMSWPNQLIDHTNLQQCPSEKSGPIFKWIWVPARVHTDFLNVPV